MIDAGLPIIQCLDILQAQQENPTLQKMIKAIKDSVEGGTTLADSLKRYPQYFDSLFVNMIAAGEAGGILDVILKRLSAYLEKAAKLKRKVKGAMVYPAITIFVAVIVVAQQHVKGDLRAWSRRKRREEVPRDGGLQQVPANRLSGRGFHAGAALRR